MVDSGSINNVPATASHFLLTEELRNRLGFKGVVISDYGDVPALQTAYHVTSDFPGAIAKAVNAGVDVSMTPFDYVGWNNGLMQDVQNKLVSEKRIDESVERILTLKFELGLFDHPYVDPNAADAAITANRDLARKAADESITLLRNSGSPPTLPLSPSAKVVVTGPSADSVSNQLGGWSVSEGIQAADANTVSVPTDQTVTQAQQQAAVTATQAADAVVVVVGERAYAEGLGDNPTPVLPADQQSLIAALEGSGKPVIVVIIAGRPLGLGPAETANALLMAYLPGTEGGAAVADVLFGAVNPSGHLPVTWPSAADHNAGDFQGTGPSTAGDEPKFFDQLPGTNFGQGSGYNARYPFGFGLSYTTFQTSGLTATDSVTSDGTVTATFTVANTGARAGDAVVPVYVHQSLSDVVVPPQRLVGFARVTLGPGAVQTVHVSFPVSQLAVTPGDIDGTEARAVEPGSYQVRVGTMTAEFSVGS